MSRFHRPKTNVRFRPTLDRCEDRTTPTVGFHSVPDHAVAVAPDDGGIPVVHIVDPTTGADVDTITAYEDSFRGGVHVALGDVTGDGVRDIVLSTGTGGGPRVRIIDGKSGDTIADFFVYEPTFTGGVYVAVGDVNGDGRGDIITGTGVGGGPRVRVLDGKTLGSTVLKDYFAYEGSFRGGVQVAAGDVNGDGAADVIAGTGVGGGPRVVAFNGRDDKVLANFFAFEDSFRGGVQVSSGDVDGDGKADILVGTGVGGGPVVKAVSGADGKVLAQFLADDPTFRGGVRVDSVDTNGDGRLDLVARTRHGNSDTVRVFDGKTGGFGHSVSRTVDDNPSPADAVEHPAGGGTVTPGVPSLVEGVVAAVDPVAGTVQLRQESGALVTVRVGPTTEVQRDGAHPALAAFTVGDKAEALVGPDGTTWKIEAKTPAGGTASHDSNSGGSSNGGSSNGGSSNSGSSNSGSSSATETRIEGTVKAVDDAAGTVTLQPQTGAAVTVRTNSKTKVERNNSDAKLKAFKVGDKAEARVGADGIATKLEATGV